MDSEILDKYLKAGRIAAEARELGISMVKDGALAYDVAEAIEDYIREKGAKPAFPANLSVNHEAAHYTPIHGDKRRFKTGDLVKVDVGAHVDGYIGDTSRTTEVGSNRYFRLIKASEEGLNTAIDVIKAGVELDEIGSSVEGVISSFGYRPIENLTGHLLENYRLHAGLSVPSVKGLERGIVREDMAIAVEPFATDGAGYVKNAGNPGIYMVVSDGSPKKPELAEFLDAIRENFGNLPFAERWCHEFDHNAQKLLKQLSRKGFVHAYEVLVDARKGLVSQREHTMIVKKDGVIITTEVE